MRATAAPIAAHLGIADRWALAIAGLLIIAVLAAGIWLLGPELARQLRGVYNQLPAAFAKLSQVLQLPSFAELLKESSTASGLGSLAARIFAWSTSVLGALASLGLVIFAGIYLAADPQLYRRGFVKLVPPSLHLNVNATLDDIGEALRRWLMGQLMAMALVGGMTGLGLWLVGVPSPFALGFIAGLAEFVPVVGPIVAAAPTLLIARVRIGTPCCGRSEF